MINGRLPNEELLDFTYHETLLGRKKSRRMRWAWHVARFGERRCV